MPGDGVTPICNFITDFMATFPSSPDTGSVSRDTIVKPKVIRQ